MKTRALLPLAALLTLPLPAHGIANPASSSPSSASSSAAAASPAATDAAKPGEDRPAAELLALMPADASVVCSRRTADFTLVFALRGDPSGISRDVRIAAQLMSPRVGEETFRQLAQAFSSEARSERMPELFLSLAYSKDESFAVNRTCRRVISTLSLIPGSRNISQGDWNGLSVDLVSVFSEFEPRFNELAGQQLGSRRIAILYRLDGQRLDIRCGEDVDKLMTCDPIDASDPAHADLLLEPSGGEAPSEADASENTTLWCNSEGLKALRSLAEITPTLPGLAPALSLIDEKSPVSFCAEESSCGYRIRAKAALKGLHFSPGTFSGAAQADADGALAYAASTPVSITNPLLLAACGELPSLLEKGAAALISEQDGRLSFSLRFDATSPAARDAARRLFLSPDGAGLPLSEAADAARIVLKSPEAPELETSAEPACGLSVRLRADRLAAAVERNESSLQILQPRLIIDYLALRGANGLCELKLSEQNGQADISLNVRKEKAASASGTPVWDGRQGELPPVKAKPVFISCPMEERGESSSPNNLRLQFVVDLPRNCDEAFISDEYADGRGIKISDSTGIKPIERVFSDTRDENSRTEILVESPSVPTGRQLKIEGRLPLTLCFGEQSFEPQSCLKSFRLDGVTFRVSFKDDELGVRISKRNAVRVKDIRLLTPDGEQSDEWRTMSDEQGQTYYFSATPPLDDYALRVTMYAAICTLPVEFDTRLRLPVLIEEPSDTPTPAPTQAPAASGEAAPAADTAD